MADDVSIRFGANIEDLQSKVGQIQGIFKDLIDRFAALAAVVAGGAAFKGVIDEANSLNSESTKLSRTLGITGEEASSLNTALGAVGADSETYTSAFLKFNRAIRAHGDELQAAGVDVDGYNKGQLTSNELFQQGLQAVMEYKPGIDQTQAAMAIFGRSIDDVQKLQKLFGSVTDETAERLGMTRQELNSLLSPQERYNENLETARQKNIALNLVQTEEGKEATRQYKEAMESVDLVLHGLEKTLGETVMPMFTESAQQLASIGPALVEGMQYAATTFVEIWKTVKETVGVIWDFIVDAVKAIVGVFASGFGEEAPSALQVFRNALGIVQAVFISFRTVVEVVINFIRGGLAELKVDFATFAEVATKALSGDFSGAWNALKSGASRRNAVGDEYMARQSAIIDTGKEAMDRALMGAATTSPKTPAGMPKGGTKSWGEIGKPKGGAESESQLIAARLALEKADKEAALSVLQEYIKEEEAQNEDAYKRGLESLGAYYDRRLALQLQANDLSMRARREELAAVQEAEAQAQAKAASATKPAERDKYLAQSLKFAAEETKLLGQINVLEAQRGEIIRKNGVERAEAERQLREALSTIGATMQKDRAFDEIADERARAAELRQLNLISAEEEFALKRQWEAREYTATQAFLATKRALIRDGDFKAMAEQQAAEEAAERSHQSKLLQIDIAADLERRKYGAEAVNSIQGSFANMLGSVLSGTARMGDAIRNFGKSVEQMFAGLIAKKFTETLFNASGLNKAIEKMVSFVTEGLAQIVRSWFTAQAEQTAATAAGASERSAIETSAAATSKAATGGSAIANIAAKAWEAAASVYASIAAIPVVGPFLAPAAAIAASAVVLGFIGRIASSEGGEYRVDEDRLNFVHKDETILPAGFAAGLRALVGEGGRSPLTMQVGQIANAIGSGGMPVAGQSWTVPNMSAPRAVVESGGGLSASGSAGGDTHAHFHINTIDSRGVERFIMENGNAIARSLHKVNRNFGGRA